MSDMPVMSLLSVLNAYGDIVELDYVFDEKSIDELKQLEYIDAPNGKKLDIMYRMAWLRGLKTTYYLRSRSATTTEKSTIDTGCLLYTSPSPRDGLLSRMPSSA